MIIKKKFKYLVEIEIECNDPNNEFTKEQIEDGIKTFMKDNIDKDFDKIGEEADNEYIKIISLDFELIENEL